MNVSIYIALASLLTVTTQVQAQTQNPTPKTDSLTKATAPQSQTLSPQAQAPKTDSLAKASAPQPQTTAPQAKSPTAQAPSPETQPFVQPIKNGRMEQPRGESWFFGYYGNQKENPNSYKFEYSIEASVSGEYSLKMSGGPVKNDSVYCSLNQSFPPTGIPIGSKLTLKAKIKTVNMQGTGMAVALRGNKTENGVPKTAFFKSTQGYVPITGTNEFEEYTAVIDSYPGNIDSLSAFIFYLPTTSGTAFIDDVSVEVEPPAPPAPTKKKK